jgi:F-type H+-transporting ATPase subunit b
MYRFVTGLTFVCALLVSAQSMADDTPKESPAESAEAKKLPSGDSEHVVASGEAHAADAASSAVPEGHGEEAGDHVAAGHAAHGGGHDAHHDPTDLSHLNAGPQLNDPSQFRSDLAIWTFVVFFCLLLILGKFAWGPVMSGLDQREESIAAMIEEAKQGQEKAAEQLKQYEAKLAAAGEEARELVAQARKDAESAKDRIVAEAQAAADRQRQRAIEDIRVAKNVALQEMTEKSVDLAVSLAGRIVRQQLKAEDHSQLIREAMDQLPSRN